MKGLVQKFLSRYSNASWWLKIKELSARDEFAKYQVFVLPAVACFISIPLLIFVLLPNVFSWFKTKAQISQIEMVNTALEDKLNVLQSVDKESYEGYLKTSLISLPEDKDVTTAISQVLFLLGSSRLQLQDFTFALSAEKDSSADVSAFGVKISALSDTAGLKEFIGKVKKAPRLLKIKNLEVSGGRAGGSINSTINLLVYYQPLPSKIGKVDESISVLDQKDLDTLSQISTSSKSTPGFGQEEATESATYSGNADPFQ